MLPTPTAPSEITAPWLAEVIGHPVELVSVRVIGEGEGFMGQVARVGVTSDDPSCPASVVVKLPTSEPGARAIGEMSRVWVREHGFYRDLAADLAIRVPRTYANLLDPPCLVLEDLAPAVPGDHVVGATDAQARQAVDVLATLHAQWFEHPRLTSLGWLPGLDDPMVHMLAPTFEIGWPIFLQRYGDELPARCLRWCERFVTGIPEWLASHADDPVTLTHGDFRLDNLFFGPDGSVTVIDWQLSMRVPGQTDLVYFCANNLTPDRRQALEHELIDRYLDALHAAGVPEDAVTRDAVWQGYVEGMLFYAVSFGASLLTIDPSNERGAALFDALVRRTFAAVDDLDAGVLAGVDRAS